MIRIGSDGMKEFICMSNSRCNIFGRKRIYLTGVIFGLVMTLILHDMARAEIEVLAHYKPGEGGAITYAAGVDKLKDISGNGNDLQKSGEPKYFASTPSHKEGMSLLFNGKTDWYRQPKAIIIKQRNFMVEAWAKAYNANHPDLHGVVANGDGANGYTLAQQNDKWVMFVGGIGAFPIGPVVKDQWTHLAIVVDGDNNFIYMNGIRVSKFQPNHNPNPTFTIGDMGRGKEAFHGEIHEVRLGAFAKGQFDPDKDFLLDYPKIRKIKEQNQLQRSQLIKSLIRPQLGVQAVDKIKVEPVQKDWLIHKIEQAAQLQVKISEDKQTTRMSLSNGLISREFYVSENLACVSYRNLSNDAEFLRAIKPEARIMLDGRWYDIGGLTGQPEKAYLVDNWLPELTAKPGAFVFNGMDTEKPVKRYEWKQKYNAQPADWPPRGLRINLHFRAPDNADPKNQGTIVTIHYEIYDGLPVIAKSVTVNNSGKEEILVEKTECEVLAVSQDQVNRIHTESDYAVALTYSHPQGSALLHFVGTYRGYMGFGGLTEWRVDPEYNSWATQNPVEDTFIKFQHRCLMVSRLPVGPSEYVAPGGKFESFITFELLNDSDDRERQTLGQRRMYRKLAPQVTENQLTFATSSQDIKHLKSIIDQMAELGFEFLRIHPPGVAHDNLDPAYIAPWKEVAHYAKERGIIIDAYELAVSSRGRGAKYDCIRPDTGEPGCVFGQSVCIASEWRDHYFPKMFEFLEKTGFMGWAADGPYHGDVCASKVHKYHHGVEDSRWEQWKIQAKVIRELQGKNMYVALPDWYFFHGQAMTGMGYREAAANLSRQQQFLLNRQYIYDGLWHKIPPMGGIGVQLVGFYTSSPHVGLEPLIEHIDLYEQNLIQCLGAGAMTVIRGNRVYDSPEVKAMVKRWLDWYRKYRTILTSDLIHLGRPSGRDLDCMMHVNPYIPTRAMVIVFNPTDRPIEKKLKLPLYYTGLTKTALVREQEQKPKSYSLDRDYNIFVPVHVKAKSYTWLVVEAPESTKRPTAGFMEKLRQGEKINVAAMGTSLTKGVQPDKEWVAQLRGWLQKEFPSQAKVINEGHGATGTGYPPENADTTRFQQL
jgi:hypothetical protein